MCPPRNPRLISLILETPRCVMPLIRSIYEHRNVSICPGDDELVRQHRNYDASKHVSILLTFPQIKLAASSPSSRIAKLTASHGVLISIKHSSVRCGANADPPSGAIPASRLEI